MQSPHGCKLRTTCGIGTLLLTRAQVKDILRVQEVLDSEAPGPLQLLVGTLVRVKVKGNYVMRRVLGVIRRDGSHYLCLKDLPLAVRPSDISGTNPLGTDEAFAQHGQHELAELQSRLEIEGCPVQPPEVAATAWRLKVALQWAAHLDEWRQKLGLARLLADLRDPARIAETAEYLQRMQKQQEEQQQQVHSPLQRRPLQQQQHHHQQQQQQALQSVRPPPHHCNGAAEQENETSPTAATARPQVALHWLGDQLAGTGQDAGAQKGPQGTAFIAGAAGDVPGLPRVQARPCVLAPAPAPAPPLLTTPRSPVRPAASLRQGAEAQHGAKQAQAQAPPGPPQKSITPAPPPHKVLGPVCYPNPAKTPSLPAERSSVSEGSAQTPLAANPGCPGASDALPCQKQGSEGEDSLASYILADVSLAPGVGGGQQQQPPQQQQPNSITVKQEGREKGGNQAGSGGQEENYRHSGRGPGVCQHSEEEGMAGGVGSKGSRHSSPERKRRREEGSEGSGEGSGGGSPSKKLQHGSPSLKRARPPPFVVDGVGLHPWVRGFIRRALEVCRDKHKLPIPLAQLDAEMRSLHRRFSLEGHLQGVPLARVCQALASEGLLTLAEGYPEEGECYSQGCREGGPPMLVVDLVR